MHTALFLVTNLIKYSTEAKDIVRNKILALLGDAGPYTLGDFDSMHTWIDGPIH